MKKEEDQTAHFCDFTHPLPMTPERIQAALG